MASAVNSPVLAIGAVMGDIDSERIWGVLIGSLSIRARSVREGVESPVHLNVVYHVDGRLKPNQFAGVRTGRFRQRDGHLIVQAAVPGGPVEDKRALLVGLLRAAVDEAEEFARRRRVADNLDVLRRLVDELVKE